MTLVYFFGSNNQNNKANLKLFTHIGRRALQCIRWCDPDHVIPIGTNFILSVLAFAAYLFWQPDFPFLETDFSSYIDFDPMRTVRLPDVSGDCPKDLWVSLYRYHIAVVSNGWNGCLSRLRNMVFEV